MSDRQDLSPAMHDVDTATEAASTSLEDIHRLEQLSDEERNRAEAWHDVMFRVCYGVTPRERSLIGPQPVAGTVEDRLKVERDRLAAAGHTVSMATMWRKYSRFKKEGILGCADQRKLPGHGRRPSTAPIVYAIVDELSRSTTRDNTYSEQQVIELARVELLERGITVPGRSTMYKIAAAARPGAHTFGEAATRRSLANSPDRSFGRNARLYPGQEVQLDSTPLDAFVLSADGKAERAELAVAIDVATRTVCSAILRPKAATSVDAIELVTGAMRPMQMRPEWNEAMSMARSFLPTEMLPEDELADYIAARPIIDVRGVFVDRGKVFVSDHFLRVLEAEGIDHRIASPYEPTAKPLVERFFRTLGESFVRWIKGDKGRAVVHRGSAPERHACWPLPLLQALLDEWVVSVYQQRRTDGLRHNLAPKVSLSPNAMYTALAGSMPSLPRVLSHDEWISLLPTEWRTIQRYGINFKLLTYDSNSTRFHTLRRRKSRHSAHNGRWQIQYDPANLMRIWLRDDDTESWIECRWVCAQHSPAPFGIDVLKRLMALIDRQEAIDKEVLDRWRALCRQLEAGPPQTPPHTDPVIRDAVSAAHSERTAALLRPPSPTRDESFGSSTDTPVPLEPVYVTPMTAVRTTDDW